MIQAGKSANSNTKCRKTSHRLLAALDLDSLSMASSVARRMGVPLPDRLPEPYLPPTSKELWKVMKRTVKKGEIFYQHPELFGRGFSKKQVNTAVGHVIKAEKALFDGFETLSPAGQSPQTIKLILEISENREFRMASEQADNKAQIRITLEALTLKLRTERVMEQDPSILRGAAEKQAKKDVEEAQRLANEFNDLKRTPRKDRKKVDGLVARMNEMEWKTDGEFFEFGLAMDAIDERRQAELIEKEEPEDVTELPGLVFLFPNLPLNAEFEKALPAKVDDRTGLIRRIARILGRYARSDSDVPGVYQEAVENLRADFSYEKAVGFATSLVDVHYQSSPLEELQRVGDRLEELQQVAEEATEDIGRMEAEAQEPLSEAETMPLPLEAPPEISEMPASAVLKELTPHERELIKGVLGKAEECTENDLTEFMDMHPGVRDLLVRNFITSRWTEGNWRLDLGKCTDARASIYGLCMLREPTKEEKMEAVLQLQHLSFNQKHLIASALNVGMGDLTERRIYNFRDWVSKDPEHLDHWKSGSVDLLTLGELAYKMMFLSGWDYTPEEVALLSIIMDATRVDVTRAATSGPVVFTVQASQDEKAELKRAFISPTVADAENYGRHVKVYRPQFQAVSQLGGDMELRSLLGAAQKQAEFHVLLDFLGIPVERASGKIDYTNTETRAKRKNGDYSTNDDSVSSAVVKLADGSKITLDAVFDGMGGHASGYAASEMAKDVFEMAAVAGWITSPEDVRRVFMIAHLAITMEQIRRLKRLRESEQFPENKKGYWLQENDMGTTGVVSFQCGREFYGIHCGDSDCMVIRDGKVVFQSVGHTLVNELRAAGQEAGPNIGHIVTSALGAVIRKMHINNNMDDPQPFLVEGNDIILTASDGITVPVCEHEFQIKIDEHGGKLAMARREIIELAESRAGVGPHPTLCECGERRGKTDDDKSLVIRYAKDG